MGNSVLMAEEMTHLLMVLAGVLMTLAFTFVAVRSWKQSKRARKLQDEAQRGADQAKQLLSEIDRRGRQQ